MIKVFSPLLTIAKRSFLAGFLLIPSGCAQKGANENMAKIVQPQLTEVVSKAAADSIKANSLTLPKIKPVKDKKNSNSVNSNVTIVPTMYNKLDPTKNTAYCPTTILVLDKFAEISKTELPFTETFTKNDIDESSLFQANDTTSQEFIRNLQNEVKANLGINSKLLPGLKVDYNPHNMTVYVAMNKDLEFNPAFDSIGEKPFCTYGGQNTSVKMFGIGHETNSSTKPAEIMFIKYNDNLPEDYEDLYESFAVRLKTKTGDEVLLLRTPRITTFNAAYNELMNSTKEYDGQRKFSYGDMLYIPYTEFSSEESFDELRKILNILFLSRKGTYIQELKQNIDFDLNPEGVHLSSESVGVLSSGFSDQLKFDRPFFVFMQKEGAENPYFAALISDPSQLQ